MPELSYGNGCSLHPDCFTCTEEDCVISTIVFPDDTSSSEIGKRKFGQPVLVLGKINSNVTLCKYCGSKSFQKSSHYKGVRIYRCNTCGHKFRDNDNYFHMKVSAVYVDMAVYLFNSKGYNLAEIREYLRKEYNYAPSKSSISNWVKILENKNREVKTANVCQS